jgi:hypothetical protein
MTQYLLKVHLQTFLSIPLTQKCQILSCNTLVANERCVVRRKNHLLPEDIMAADCNKAFLEDKSNEEEILQGLE